MKNDPLIERTSQRILSVPRRFAGNHDLSRLEILVEECQLLPPPSSRKPEHPILTITSDLESPGPERILLSGEILSTDIADADAHMNLGITRQT